MIIKIKSKNSSNNNHRSSNKNKKKEKKLIQEQKLKKLLEVLNKIYPQTNMLKNK